MGPPLPESNRALLIAPALLVAEPLLHARVAEPLVAALLEEAAGGVAGVDGEALRAAGASELLDRIVEELRDALPGRGRMDVEHLDVVRLLQRGEADRRAGHGGDERQVLREPRPERPLVIRERRPGGLLRRAVVL